MNDIPTRPGESIQWLYKIEHSLIVFGVRIVGRSRHGMIELFDPAT